MKNIAYFRFGFTLMEVMVSCGIIVLLIVIISQVTHNTSITTGNIAKRMDADSEARIIFERMSTDIAKMVKRSDVDYIFAKQKGNDCLFFYSEAPAYFSTSGSSAVSTQKKSTLALVGYRINASLQLERLGKGLTWDGAADGENPGGAMFFVYSTGQATPDMGSTIAGAWSSIGTAQSHYSDGTDDNFHVIADQAYRLEINFILKDGSIAAKPITNPAGVTNNLGAGGPPTVFDDCTNYVPGSRWYDDVNGKGYYCVSAEKNVAVWRPIGIQDIIAINIAIAILDRGSRKIVTDNSQMVAALPEAVNNESILKTWCASHYLTESGIPQAAASQIRIYQRTFYLNDK